VLRWQALVGAQLTPKDVDMRLPVNPRSLTVLSSSSSVQAGGHMDSALDHADI